MFLILITLGFLTILLINTYFKYQNLYFKYKEELKKNEQLQTVNNELLIQQSQILNQRSLLSITAPTLTQTSQSDKNQHFTFCYSDQILNRFSSLIQNQDNYQAIYQDDAEQDLYLRTQLSPNVKDTKKENTINDKRIDNKFNNSKESIGLSIISENQYNQKQVCFQWEQKNNQEKKVEQIQIQNSLVNQVQMNKENLNSLICNKGYEPQQVQQTKIDQGKACQSPERPVFTNNHRHHKSLQLYFSPNPQTNQQQSKLANNQELFGFKNRRDKFKKIDFNKEELEDPQENINQFQLLDLKQCSDQQKQLFYIKINKEAQFSQGSPILLKQQQYLQFNKSSKLQICPLNDYRYEHYLEQGRYNRSFEQLETLGMGGFGKVFKVKHKLDQNLYAIKQIRINLAIDQDIKQHRVYREIKSMPQLSHKNIVRYYSCWIENVVLPKQNLQSIAQIVQNQNKLNYKKQEKIKEQCEDLESNSSESPMVQQDQSFYDDLQRLNPQIESQMDSNMLSEDSQSIDSQSDSLLSQDSNQTIIDYVKKQQDFITLDLMIQMEYCQSMTLRDYLDDRKRNIDRHLNLIFFKQLLSGLNHIHEVGLIHRDIKPANIFIKDKHVLKIGDFGLAKEQNQQLKKIMSMNSFYNMNIEGKEEDKNQNKKKEIDSRQAGTPLYQSPEQLSQDQQEVDEKVDIYAAGLILFELCSQFSTMHERSEGVIQLRKDRVLKQEFKDNFKVESEIILRMTNPKPINRPSAKQVLESQHLKHWAIDSQY